MNLPDIIILRFCYSFAYNHTALKAHHPVRSGSLYLVLGTETSWGSENYSAEVEAALNKQVNVQLQAGYSFQAMSNHFECAEIALPNLAKYFRRLADEELLDAEKLKKYQNSRGGRVLLKNVQKPEQDEWHNAMEAFKFALELQKRVNAAYLELLNLAEGKVDPQTQHFIKSEFLSRKLHVIEQLANAVANLHRLGDTTLGEFLFDRQWSEVR